MAQSKGGKTHQCGKVFCQPCDVHVLLGDHKCYIKPHIVNDAERKKNQQQSLSFYDIETYVDEQGLLIPNLLVRN